MSLTLVEARERAAVISDVSYAIHVDLSSTEAGVLDEVAVRDAGLLAAAAGRPRTTVFGADAYPTFEDKTAVLLHSLVRNYALVDGNKRLAWAAARIFCLLNDRALAYTVDDAEQMMLAAAAGTLDVADIASWLRRHGLGASQRRMRVATSWRAPA